VNAASSALIGARASTAIALPEPAAAPTRSEEVQEDEVAR